MVTDILSEQEADMVVRINGIIKEFNDSVVSINSQHEYDDAIARLIKIMFDAFNSEYEQINNHELYKNLFLKMLRSKQDDFFQSPKYANIYSQIRQLHGKGYKTQTFFDSILLYCTQNYKSDVPATILYLINLEAVLAGWQQVNGHHRNYKIMSEKNTNKKTLTPEQKNSILKTLLENEDVGTLNGAQIATELNVNVKYVMALITDLENRAFIEYTGMAQYYFQVNVTPDGIDFLNNGGFVAEQKQQNTLHNGSQILNSASFGNNVSIIIGPGNVQNITNWIGRGDAAALRRTLEHNSVSNEDIVELENIIDNDNPRIEEKKFGTKVNEWVKKMLGKSLDGIWKVGIGTASKVLGDAIEQYYGIKH